MDKIRIIAIIISIFLLVGATSCQMGGTKTNGGVSETYTGSDGLILNFIDGMPPQNIWKDVEFDVGLDVQNKGLVDVDKGKVCFNSMSEKVFSKPDGCKDIGEPLRGRLDFPDGEIRSYIWEGYDLKESYKEDSEYPLTAKVCYIAETRANPIICVKSMSYETKSVCEAGEITLENANNGQGAPVAVSSVYEDVIPKKGEGVELRFTITVTNLGGGEILDLDKLDSNENCNFGRLDKNKIKIEAALTGYDLLDCGKSEINLGVDAAEGTIMCKTKEAIAVEEGESYPLPLNIKLNYGYLSSISSKFTIKKDIVEEGKK